MPETKPFVHNWRHLILGVCGHWWQTDTQDLDDVLLGDCPECHRPPSHILRKPTFMKCWEIAWPPDCVAPQ